MTMRTSTSILVLLSVLLAARGADGAPIVTSAFRNVYAQVGSDVNQLSSTIESGTFAELVEAGTFDVSALGTQVSDIQPLLFSAFGQAQISAFGSSTTEELVAQSMIDIDFSLLEPHVVTGSFTLSTFAEGRAGDVVSQFLLSGVATDITFVTHLGEPDINEVVSAVLAPGSYSLIVLAQSISHGTDGSVAYGDFDFELAFVPQNTATVPEPGTMMLVALGGVVGLGRRFRGNRSRGRVTRAI